VKQNKIALVKVLRTEIPFKTVLIPVDEEDIKTFKNVKVGQVLYCKIQSNRSYERHKFLFRVFVVAIDNGILEKMVTKGIISQAILDYYMQTMKNETDVILFLSKWFLLPLEKAFFPDGKDGLKVSSISFEAMSEIDFLDFRDNKLVPWVADILEIDQQLLRDMAKYPRS
jgi:hypothetical protein